MIIVPTDKKGFVTFAGSFAAGGMLDPQNKAGVSLLTAAMLAKGPHDTGRCGFGGNWASRTTPQRLIRNRFCHPPRCHPGRAASEVLVSTLKMALNATRSGVRGAHT